MPDPQYNDQNLKDGDEVTWSHRDVLAGLRN